jgi:hypothetical protein
MNDIRNQKPRLKKSSQQEIRHAHILSNIKPIYRDAADYTDNAIKVGKGITETLPRLYIPSIPLDKVNIRAVNELIDLAFNKADVTTKSITRTAPNVHHLHITHHVSEYIYADRNIFKLVDVSLVQDKDCNTSTKQSTIRKLVKVSFYDAVTDVISTVIKYGDQDDNCDENENENENNTSLCLDLLIDKGKEVIDTNLESFHISPNYKLVRQWEYFIRLHGSSPNTCVIVLDESQERLIDLYFTTKTGVVDIVNASASSAKSFCGDMITHSLKEDILSFLLLLKLCK